MKDLLRDDLDEPLRFVEPYRPQGSRPRRALRRMMRSDRFAPLAVVGTVVILGLLIGLLTHNPPPPLSAFGTRAIDLTDPREVELVARLVEAHPPIARWQLDGKDGRAPDARERIRDLIYTRNSPYLWHFEWETPEHPTFRRVTVAICNDRRYAADRFPTYSTLTPASARSELTIDRWFGYTWRDLLGERGDPDVFEAASFHPYADGPMFSDPEPWTEVRIDLPRFQPLMLSPDAWTRTLRPPRDRRREIEQARRVEAGAMPPVEPGPDPFVGPSYYRFDMADGTSVSGSAAINDVLMADLPADQEFVFYIGHPLNDRAAILRGRSTPDGRRTRPSSTGVALDLLLSDDADGDGAADFTEILAGTFIDSIDSDGDGNGDLEELLAGTAPAPAPGRVTPDGSRLLSPIPPRGALLSAAFPPDPADSGRPPRHRRVTLDPERCAWPLPITVRPTPNRAPIVRVDLHLDETFIATGSIGDVLHVPQSVFNDLTNPDGFRLNARLTDWTGREGWTHTVFVQLVEN